jgi:DNA-binding Lrp family transcriptional regulator
MKVLTDDGARQPAVASRVSMLRAYILIQTEVGTAAAVASAVTCIDGVTSVSTLNGPYDVVAEAQAANVDELGRIVMDKIQTVDGITRTLTCPVVRP